MNQPPTPRLSEPAWVRAVLITITVLFLSAFLLLPLAVVFHSAFRDGFTLYAKALVDPIAVDAIKLTLIAAGFSLVFNTVFGVATAWCITRFTFPGKAVLLTLIDLPFAVSPVIAGLIFILIFGAQGWAGNKPIAMLWPWTYWLALVIAVLLAASAVVRLRSGHGIAWWRWSFATVLALVVLIADPFIRRWLGAGNDIPVVFSTPGIILATAFVTFPFVARELIPVMQSVGQEEELAALTLGARGWTIFWRVTLPNVKWGLLYGLVLCNARAMGEFGAVSVISGHIRGQTNTMPLHIEILFNEYHFTAAFAVSSVLALLALVTLVAKTVIEHRLQRSKTSAETPSP